MPQITYTRYLEISGIPLATPAWKVVDLSPLLDGPDVRGGDRILPGAAGVKGYPRVRTAAVRTLELLIFGDKDQDGGSYADVRVGIDTNALYLRTNLLEPVATGNGTRPAVLHLQDGTTRTADVHVLPPLRLGAISHRAVRGTLDISIPAGRFT